jgi:autotransporter-associated beta strand protein
LIFFLPALRVHAAPPVGYYLVWGDEFNSTTLDTTKWDYWLLGSRRDAVNTSSAVSLNGSNLVITTYTSGGTHYTAMVATDGTFRSRYGYWESSIKWGDTNGMWSAFWMQSPTMGSYLSDPFSSGSEIDIVEHRYVDGSANNIANQVQNNIHWNGYGSAAKSAGSGNIGGGLATGFHTYGFLWTPSVYTLYVDGSNLRSWSYANNAVPVSQSTEWAILSSEVDDTSTTWAGYIPSAGYGSLATSTTKLAVDYVRYYAPTTTIFWTGVGSIYLTNSANWVSNMPPVSTSDLTFSSLSGNNLSPALGGDLAVDGLVFLNLNNGLSVAGGNTLTLGAGGIDMIAANHTITVNCAVALSANQTWSVGPNNPGNTFNLGGPLSGSAALTKAGAGTLVLSGTNGFSGTLNVDTSSSTSSDGAVQITRNESIANAAAISIRNNNGGSSTLQLNGSPGNITVPQNISLAGRNTNVAAIENISGSNTLAGALTINTGGSYYLLQSDAGTLNLQGPISSAASGTRSFSFQGAGDFYVSGPIQNGSATISVTKTDSGTLTLAGANTFNGLTRVNSGLLRLANGAALQNSTLDMNAADTGTLSFASLNSATFGGLTGLRALSLNNANSGPVILTVGNNNQSTDFGGVLSGSGGLVKTGSGATTLSGTNTFSGATTLNSGTLRLGPNTNLIATLQPLVWLTFDSVGSAIVTNAGTGGSAMNAGIIGSGAAIVSGGRYGKALSLNGDGSSVRITNRVTAFDGNTAGVSWTLALWLKTSQAGAGYAYQGDGGWVSGNTAFYLNQGNTTSGTRAGAVRWGGGWLTGNAALNDNNWHFVAISVNSGAKTIYVDGRVDASFPASTWPNASTGSQVWIGGTADTGDGVAAMNGLIDEVFIFSRALSLAEVQTLMNNQPLGCPSCYVGQLPAATPLSVAAGAIFDLNGVSQTLASVADTGVGGGLLTSMAGVPATLALAGNASLTNTFSGTITDAGPSGALNLVKSGTSTQILAGSTGYHGTTTVTGGALLIDGALGTNSVTVTGGILGGTGSVGGPIIIQPGGALAPGGSLSPLTISNTLTLAGATFIELSQAAHTNDSVRGLTSVSYGGTLNLTNLSGTLTPADTFKLFDASAYAGAFAALSPASPGAGLVWNTNTLTGDGTLRIGLARPAINSVTFNGANLVFAGSNGLPAGTFSVLSSTNATLPLPNWLLLSTGAFDADGFFTYTNSVDPAAPQQFFILRQP